MKNSGQHILFFERFFCFSCFFFEAASKVVYILKSSSKHMPHSHYNYTTLGYRRPILCGFYKHHLINISNVAVLINNFRDHTIINPINLYQIAQQVTHCNCLSLRRRHYPRPPRRAVFSRSMNGTDKDIIRHFVSSLISAPSRYTSTKMRTFSSRPIFFHFVKPKIVFFLCLKA